MANNIVQLTDYDNNNIYPIAGAAAEGSITKTMLDEGVFVGAELSDPGLTAYVATADIQDSAVTTAKIADLNVTTNKLATGAVTSDKIDSATITLTNVTTSTYGNITTTLPKATTVPICANLSFNNGFATFYTYPETDYWILHICQVGSGDALPNASFSSIKVYYLGSI